MFIIYRNIIAPIQCIPKPMFIIYLKYYCSYPVYTQTNVHYLSQILMLISSVYPNQCSLFISNINAPIQCIPKPMFIIYLKYECSYPVYTQTNVHYLNKILLLLSSVYPNQCSLLK